MTVNDLRNLMKRLSKDGFGDWQVRLADSDVELWGSVTGGGLVELIDADHPYAQEDK